MTPTLTFTCSICGEASTDICVYCTKDACRNHRCVRCKRCSDCCECEVPLGPVDEPAPMDAALPVAPAEAADGQASAAPYALEPMDGFNDAPPAPAGAPWVDVMPKEPPFPDPPLEPEPAPAPQPPPTPNPFPQPEPERKSEPPLPHPHMQGTETAPPLPHPAEPQPEPEPDNPALPTQTDQE